jgi:hypothetical protein
VRISRREHEKGTWPLGHTSLDAPAAAELSLLEQLTAPVAEPTLKASLTGPALAIALRLTVLEGLSCGPAVRAWPVPCASSVSKALSAPLCQQTTTRDAFKVRKGYAGGP